MRPLGSPRPLSYSLAQDGIYTSFYLSVSNLSNILTYSLTSLTYSHVCGVPIHTIFYFLLLICLMSTQFLDWPKESRGIKFSSSPTSHLRLLAVSDNQMQSHTEAPELSFLQMPSRLTFSPSARLDLNLIFKRRPTDSLT